MSCLRLGSLIWLILIASALPAIAYPDSATLGTTQEASTSPANNKEQDPKPRAVIAPQADLWDGGARASTPGLGAVLIACLLADDAGARLQAIAPEPLHWTDADDAIGGAAEPCWLACRYAHAPPLA